ncbi:lanthionine synthetase C family protein [Streptomyces sp. NBC_01210]|uniref:lanthionine synthetase C family protein n=1 Tax=Streptomyces sp. NBC_01210 TaxID=2903774 RepID=UPI002E112722|nr:lanthionine synthetase C family protein [Streptomyces sp. NBC_01210]
MNDLAHDLGRGLAGTIVHQAAVAQSSGNWEMAHTTAKAMAGQPAAVDPASASLYRGAPAMAFALHTAGHHAYRPALDGLDDALATLVNARLSDAHRRMDTGRPPRMQEYDLIGGLTGLGAYLLRRGTRPDVLDGVLHYLVQLFQKPVTVHGQQVPGWWTSDSPSGQPDTAWPEGHGNFSTAHGVAGPIALLALCTRAGHTVQGQRDTLEQACSLLEEWSQRLPDGGTAWPETVTLDMWLSGPPPLAHPGRPSWCYGTPGIARALQLAALACNRTDTQRHAENALTSCATDPEQLARITDSTVCHGWAGLCLAVDRAAADTTPGSALSRLLPSLRARFATHVAQQALPDAAGLLTGADGILLTLHTLNPARPVASGWETCLLLN